MVAFLDALVQESAGEKVEGRKTAEGGGGGELE